MPNSKNADVRIKVIDRCLSDKNRKYSMAEMMELCNKELELCDFPPVSAMNTIRNDIEQIQRIYTPNADVESFREGRNIRYHYVNPDFSIYSPLLKPEEKAQLIQTLCLLKRFKGMPQFDWITEISDRLGASLRIDTVSTDEVVGFDENMDLEGLDHFTPLFNAISEKRTLCITYKSFKQDKGVEYVVYPYYLKQYNKRWFLIARNVDYDTVTNYALDRIQGIKDSDVPFQPADINFTDYFDEMIGVSKIPNSDPVLVKLWVSPVSLPYVRTKPLHGTQKKISEDATGAVITIEVYLNYELEQLILSFGENMEVLEPEWFREKIKMRIEKGLERYGE
jgi:predicted DNA-binding transcriptional regulator YafY